MPCVSLAHAAATTLGMILNRRPCDWRRQAVHVALSQTTSGRHLKINNSALGVTLGPDPSISVGAPPEFANAPLQHNQEQKRATQRFQRRPGSNPGRSAETRARRREQDLLTARLDVRLQKQNTAGQHALH